MIKKMSSKDFNNILQDSRAKAEELSSSIKSIKENIDKKMMIIAYENEYNNYCLSTMLSKTSDYSYTLVNNNNKGLYSSYSNLIHPLTKQEPFNILNLKTIDGFFFRDDVTVSMNGVSTDNYKNMLKHDKIPTKEIFFEELIHKEEINEDGTSLVKDRRIELSMEIDNTKVLGISKFNMIEIDPFLYRSFDIESIKIYEDDYQTPILVSDAIPNVGKTRLVFDKKYNFKKVTFTIIPNYFTDKESETIIPFGIKHIYFYNADFRNDSSVIIPYISDKNIDYISNELEIITPYGIVKSSLKEEGIKIFLDNNGGVLESEHEPTLTVKKPISRNTNRIHFKVPLRINEDLRKNSTIGYKFNIKNR